MKNLFLLLLISLTIYSCALDDDVSPSYTFELTPIDSINVPDTLDFEESYIFNVYYTRTSSCQSFEGYDYTIDTNARTIGVVDRIYFNDCEPVNEVITQELPFDVVRDDYYIFKFWTGQNQQGEDTFITKEVPVRTE
ncbi:hypothetical protein [Mesonia mobilis]|uniref:Lipoprotein n=1 Tax=Mesonia mobilis TaxID=369791 RepID=A0ABQ3BGC3_9FLAO|nr:hypothetical protein [Mesonia mobilis]MBQ0736885.1 hypothetical protein [Aquimarina celericrescens]GGZ43386.1 hypothetical protein GCM10008088_00380 [Mesonia mobilis]|tara:strand:+ start:397 stop:807 length:411 start_codon:yes stop_codon:yes gene_type:complete